jgi:hypothetical protein
MRFFAAMKILMMFFVNWLVEADVSVKRAVSIFGAEADFYEPIHTAT